MGQARTSKNSGSRNGRVIMPVSYTHLVHRLQRLKHSLRLLFNQLLMLGESARRNHQLADALHLLIAQLGIAQAIVQKRCVLLVEGCGGERHQHGTLTLTQVIASGLTGHLGLAEDAQLVITQLEALTQRQAERAVTGKYRVLLAHGTGAVLQRGSLQSQSTTNREGVLAGVQMCIRDRYRDRSATASPPHTRAP